MGILIIKGLFSWKACGPCVIWENGDINQKEDKKRLWIIYLYSRLDMAWKVLLGKKCVCDIGEKGISMEVERILIITMENG